MCLPDHPIARIVNLVFNAGLASAVPGLRWCRSIFGEQGSRMPTIDSYDTEWTILPPECLQIANHFMTNPNNPTPSGPIAPLVGGDSEHRQERWFFINGICTDREMAELHVTVLTEMFGRPVTILYNATHGLVADLYEAAIGKSMEMMTEGAEPNVPPLITALLDDDLTRVVLISHSQGTIIAAVLLKLLHEALSPAGPMRGAGTRPESRERHAARRLRQMFEEARPATHAARHRTNTDLQRLTNAHIGKLELYCFANCATSMAPFATVASPPRLAPWIESYGNERDLVARLGVLAPPHGVGSARIEGDRYCRPRAWGHMLNAHYLVPMARALAHSGVVAYGANLRQQPRLGDYLGGATPPGYP